MKKVHSTNFYRCILIPCSINDIFLGSCIACVILVAVDDASIFVSLIVVVVAVAVIVAVIVAVAVIVDVAVAVVVFAATVIFVAVAVAVAVAVLFTTTSTSYLFCIHPYSCGASSSRIATSMVAHNASRVAHVASINIILLSSIVLFTRPRSACFEG